MANSNAPFGLRPTMRGYGGECAQADSFWKPSANATCYINDVLVVLTGSLNQAHPTQGITVSAQKCKPLSTPGTGNIIGVALARVATGADAIVPVLINNNQVFEAQATTVAVADIGKNANISIGTAGNDSTGQSGQQIDGATIAATATLDAQLIGLARDADAAFGAYGRVMVMLSRHNQVEGRTGV